MSDVVLALDLATATGWAIGPVGGEPRLGALNLGGKGAGRGEKGMALIRFLNDLLRLEKPRLIVVEKPLSPAVLGRIGATEDTAALLYGLPFIVETVAHGRGVYNVRLVDVQDVRQHFVGQRTFKDGFDPITRKKIPARQMGKSAVINACRLNGWHVTNDNIADAAATWSYGCALLNPRTGFLHTPLFAGARAR